jgi:histidine ammonia-lyase
MQLLAYDLLTATYWMDVRKVEGPNRAFGKAPTAVWTAFRKVVPWQRDIDSRPDTPLSAIAYEFLKETPATSFYPAGPAMPATDGEFAGRPEK